MMNHFIRLAIRGISLSQIQSGIYVLLLEEETGRVKLPIIIESIQAQSIAYAIGKKNTYRYFTHDLFFTLLQAFNIKLNAVVIYKLINGIFFSYILFESISSNNNNDELNKKKKENKKKECKIESKTSDAIALAVRFQSPIYATKEIFDKGGISFENGFTIDDNNNINENYELIDDHNTFIFFNEKSQQDLEKMTDRDLNVLLNQAVVNEYYELAAKIKKELDRRE
ncbi:bifunctional nuclease family protein [Blattabacterium cuenoti]|uniref:bifunctional nuclease family protein n=1 Tax=Blattabacterium cuenoti TaxID=1653831 RepID=UPI00293B8BA4|nr:bifunctional nuclease family protein [Blattabacterium cuenoti]